MKLNLIFLVLDCSIVDMEERVAAPVTIQNNIFV